MYPRLHSTFEGGPVYLRLGNDIRHRPTCIAERVDEELSFLSCSAAVCTATSQ
ncbi:hypothetical protein M406DRAFT_56167 [Cryphonectria parasitica EP155]|uniref:Uncharacterized protein n=1 Tax=Cryphonectria parasitica (strain ATCC 38755 / EP155) TaxID=660469 RepID=A0A9P5CSX7_CRYP1|nr:uncharacterized protein M406DRAFT_56167 [Cryphonectria parasitica EP155]KAF3768575.1 hypothetical protein M406DRAFT_56167 [Cryphonectria parasitica EP155]